ncbi:MAG: glycosyltransferase family 2 protein, partial [Planctomycetota bacterium]
MAPKTTVVSVAYHSLGTIGAALAPLREACEADELRVVVVDNASRDGTAEHVRREHGWATLVESGVNLGYGKGCNLGFRYATTPYVMFLNPDAVLEMEAIRTLERFMDEHPRAGIVAPALVLPWGALHPVGGQPTPGTVCWRAICPSRFERATIEPGGAPFTTDWLSGAVQMIRSETMRALRGFDPRFFLYFEETDLCRRAIESGWELWAVGEASGEHAGGASLTATGQELQEGANVAHFYPSRLYHLAKHHGRAAACAVELFEVGAVATRAVLRSALGLDAA